MLAARIQSLVQADGDALERACLSGLVTGGCDDIG